ncbi:nicotinate phosphoribosyltransferase [Candidatus Woesearchaeota archaeon]|nr:nicotinate phosphoribosyltransferase [Candidatus Woesearchaeota archaeon]
MKEKTMLTDLYQLTMNAAYFDNQKDDMATFDLFIRKLPQDWGFFIANGIEDAIDYVTNLQFTVEDIQYLKDQQIFNEDFLETLPEFRFNGEVYAVKEGTPIMPNTPVMRVTAKRTEAQFVETALLNMINFQTMIATKANRVVNAAKRGNKDAVVVDFGLRRAQEEDAAMKGSRATYVGGAVATSNVKAGKEYGIPISGTHAHSFVMSFKTEIEAFRAYAKTFPNKPTLLIDTYDTEQGARNASIVGKELEAQGKQLGAVRLDSGDLADLSQKVRKILDEQGLDYVKVLASNDLNEYKIDEMNEKGAVITGYGVGTEMITAKPVAAISGVYKLVEDNQGGKIKLAPGKKTYPGKKQIYRQEVNGEYKVDILALEDEKVMGKPLLEQVVKDGERVRERPKLAETREYCLNEVAKMPEALKQTRVIEQYQVQISYGLNNLVNQLTDQFAQQ